MPDTPECDLREKLIGFGEKSIHKSYFPQLYKRLEELELFHALLDRANDPIFLVDTNSDVVIEANQAAYNLFGLNKVERAWKSFMDLFGNARQAPGREGPGGMAEGETREVSHVSPSGQRVYFELTLSTMTISGLRYTVGVARDITARKQAEEALREREQQLRTLFETAPVGIYVSTGEGRYLASNPANAAIHGYAGPEELLGQVTDMARDVYVDPEQRQILLRRLRREGEVKNFECLRKKKDGSPIWVSTSARLSRDPKTGQEIINGFSIDFTERRQAEQETREAKDFLYRIVDSIGDPIFVKDDTHRHVLVNNALCAIIGRPREAILGHTDYDFFPREEVDGFWQFDNAVLATGAENVTEEELTGLSGKKHTIVTKKTRYVDVLGKRYVVGVIRDITERKQAERELEASEEKFRSIVESSPTAMYFYRLEADGRLVLTGANPAADSTMGFAHQPLLGKTLEEIFPHLARTHVPELYRKVARGEIGAQSYQGVHQDERATAFQDVHVFRTGPAAITVDILDITERVRLQEMMLQSEKMASVGGLAAGMAHEINNPLSSILQGAQVSLMQLAPDVPANKAAAEECGCPIEAVRCYLEKRRVIKFLEGIQEAGRRAAQIVSSMLEFSRKSESRRAMADINEILDKSVELASTDYDLKKKYDFRHIAIIREYDPGLPEVSCTRTEIEQVILNLLKNAAQAMAEQPPPEGGPAIVLRTLRADDSVRIEVSDNGPGMTEAVRRRIFEPFFTTKEPGQGTGLGLSVSYFIITANHGGTISVESEPGQGARFIIDLPLGERK